MKKKLIYSFILLTLFKLPISLFSQPINGLQNNQSKNKIVIARGDGFYPPNEMMVDQKVHGLHIDLIKTVAKKMDYDVEFLSVPWVRALHLIENGSVDAISYATKTNPRQRFIIYNDGNKLSMIRNSYFILRENKGKIIYKDNLINLIGQKIGKIRGYVYDKKFDDADFLTKDKRSSNETQIINKLILKHIQIGIGAKDRVRFYSRQIGVEDKIYFLSPSAKERAVYLGFSIAKNHYHLSSKFANEMIKFKKTDEFKKIKKKWDSYIVPDSYNSLKK